MLHLVLLSLILVASDAYLFDDPPAPCCVTNIYSGILLNIGGSLEANSSTPKINDQLIEIHYNWDTKMMALVTHTLNQTTNKRDTVFVLNRYLQKTSHILLADGRCFVQTIDSNDMQPPCIPAGATYEGSFVVGSGSDGIVANGWSFPLGTFRFGVTVTADGHCVPISMSNYGSDAQGTMSLNAYLFADIQLNHVNATYFNFPSACANAIPIPSTKRSAETVSGVKHPFGV